MVTGPGKQGGLASALNISSELQPFSNGAAGIARRRSLLQDRNCGPSQVYVSCNAPLLCSPSFEGCRDDGAAFCKRALDVCMQNDGDCTNQTAIECGSDCGNELWVSTNFLANVNDEAVGGEVYCNYPNCDCNATTRATPNPSLCTLCGSRTKSRPCFC
jgi:hypothetical protein